MLNQVFFINFLKLSNYQTLGAIMLLLFTVYILKIFKNKKVSFSSRMTIALFLGLFLGVLIEKIGSLNLEIYQNFAKSEISLWYGLLGSGFLKLIQLIAVPIVFLSIIEVMVNLKADSFKKLTFKTLLLLLGTTAISAIVAIAVMKFTSLSTINFTGDISKGLSSKIESVTSSSFPEFFINIIPNNFIATMSSNGNIVSVVIIASLIASALRFLNVKKPEKVEIFNEMIAASKVVVVSVLTNILKFMPYAIVALVASTIIKNGLQAIYGTITFILTLYLTVFLMLIVYGIILIFIKVNPLTFYKKAFSTMIFAFSSRSSVGTLPLTLDTLENKMGVSNQSAKFVATLGTTIGMNGCAGVFPAMLAMMLAQISGQRIDSSFIATLILVVVIGSIGIAGVPGTATVAATVTLNGMGMGSYFNEIGAIFGIDPIVDMGRTMLNVTGGMLSSVVVDKWEGNFNQDLFNQK